MAARLIAAVLVLGALDARFTAVVALLGMVVLLATAAMRRKLKDLNKKVSDHDGKVSGFLQETVEKLLMVQAMDVSKEVEHRADVLLEDRYAIQRKRKNVSLITNMGISVMSYGAGFLALVWCAHRMLLGQMSFGSLTAVIQLVNQVQSPLVNLSGILPKYVAMTASAERLQELESIQGDPVPIEEEPKELYRRMDAIVAKDLCFSYDRDRILEPAAFTLPKGAFNVITGPSGIGKSTLLKLLLGGAPILLLDECTSALDADTEQKVLRRLRALPDRTCIAVTHRPAAIALCDWRLEVHDGKIDALWVNARENRQ